MLTPEADEDPGGLKEDEEEDSIRSFSFDISDIGKETLLLLGEYIPKYLNDRNRAEVWAAEQVRLVILAERNNDREFFHKHEYSLGVLASLEGVDIKAGTERALQERFRAIGDLVLLLLTKI